jgi:hypothetical protein
LAGRISVGPAAAYESRSAGHREGLGVEVDEVRKTFAELKARGVKFVDAQPRKEWWAFQPSWSILT